MTGTDFRRVGTLLTRAARLAATVALLCEEMGVSAQPRRRRRKRKADDDAGEETPPSKRSHKGKTDKKKKAKGDEPDAADYND